MSLRILFDPNSKEYATNAELERDLRDSDRDVYSGRTIEEQERDRDSTVIVAVTVALT